MTESGPFLVGITGGSGSGKTTLARALAGTLGADRVALLAHDAYYCDRHDVDPAERDGLDYDVPDALDHALFLADLRRIRAGETIVPPRYCFAMHRRLGTGTPVEPREIVVADGLLLFHDPAVRALLDLRIFLDAPVALRRERRIARDVVERARTRESVLKQFTRTVHPAHLAHVEPMKAEAHLVLLNAEALAPLVEVAATVIENHVARRQEATLGAGRVA